MRILLTSESYLPYLSGVTVSVDALARGLGARGHEVMVLAPRPASGAPIEEVGSPGPEPQYAWLTSYQLPRVVPFGYRMALPNPVDPALRRARRFAPDVVHAHSPFATGVMARRIARAGRRPLVFTHHTRFDDYRALPRAARRRGIGAHRRVPPPLLARLVRDHRAVDGARRRDPRAASRSTRGGASSSSPPVSTSRASGPAGRSTRGRPPDGRPTPSSWPASAASRRRRAR